MWKWRHRTQPGTGSGGQPGFLEPDFAAAKACFIADIALLNAQSIQPTYPATEFIRMNGQVIAAEHMSPPAAAIAVSVSPKDATLAPGQQESFKAIVTGTSNMSVTWSISPNYGTITQAGVYTAPSSIAGAPIVAITATS